MKNGIVRKEAKRGQIHDLREAVERQEIAIPASKRGVIHRRTKSCAKIPRRKKLWSAVCVILFERVPQLSSLRLLLPFSPYSVHCGPFCFSFPSAFERLFSLPFLSRVKRGDHTDKARRKTRRFLTLKKFFQILKKDGSQRLTSENSVL